MNHSCRWITICLGCALIATAAPSLAQTFTTLAYFTTDEGTGAYSALIQGRGGDFYGTSTFGGTNGAGTVFKLTPAGTLTALYAFCAQASCTDGENPGGALALGIDGNFYGTTFNGGAHSLGTIFKLTPEGSLTVLHSFEGTDGSQPAAGLALASDGNFYGTTVYGGPDGSCPCGTVFKITTAGTLTMLHSFNYSDGYDSSAPLIQASDGNLYGTTVSGGSSDACSDGEGCGTVFKITTAGTFTSLHSFDFTDGAEPYAPLVQATNGALYGNTFAGGDVNIHGCYGGCGTIFKISPGGVFATTVKFDDGIGGGLDSGLIQANNGALYGGNPLGGAGDQGEIFELTLPATISTVYTFSAGNGGGGSTAVLQATNGEFYGTYGAPGAAFSLNVGLAPFVAFVVPAGKAGQRAQILGQGLIGTTSVTFNGVPATSFSVASDTYMTAVIPSGATTGSVAVTTPTGKLSSNVSFNIKN
jgi:uncharacterized repeat protein (TIGR03803 family)